MVPKKVLYQGSVLRFSLPKTVFVFRSTRSRSTTWWCSSTRSLKTRTRWSTTPRSTAIRTWSRSGPEVLWLLWISRIPTSSSTNITATLSACPGQTCLDRSRLCPTSTLRRCLDCRLRPYAATPYYPQLPYPGFPVPGTALDGFLSTVEKTVPERDGTVRDREKCFTGLLQTGPVFYRHFWSGVNGKNCRFLPFSIPLMLKSSSYTMAKANKNYSYWHILAS